ncbi:MAG: hypothetical protein KDI74_00050 [Gammaproteobacteria bacterium]|nr:hypothetical protein [Gammaproteobacteria bacterium]
MRGLKLAVLLPLSALLAVGCSVKAPTIAHTHIGHAITGWRTTPGQQGLLVVAENKAVEALEHAQRAALYGSDTDAVKAEVSNALIAINPQGTGAKSIQAEPPFGLQQALVGAVDHITFAANSEDATQNVRAFAEEFAANSSAVVERCNLIELLGKDIQASSSAEEVEILTRELSALAEANLNGIDADGDGITGNTPEEQGVRQLRAALDAVLEREEPPYTTVSQWYLFNLIRLPTGEWRFEAPPADTGGGGGGGY